MAGTRIWAKPDHSKEGFVQPSFSARWQFATDRFLELGILLSEQQRYKEAVQELRHATELDPEHAQAHYRLAQAYQRTGQQELAGSR